MKNKVDKLEGRVQSMLSAMKKKHKRENVSDDDLSNLSESTSRIRSYFKTEGCKNIEVT